MSIDSKLPCVSGLAKAVSPYRNPKRRRGRMYVPVVFQEESAPSIIKVAGSFLKPLLMPSADGSVQRTNSSSKSKASRH